MRCLLILLALHVCALGAFPQNAPKGDRPWQNLVTKDFAAWKGTPTQWEWGGDSTLNPDNPKLLKSKPGEGVLVNGPKGRASNLYTKEKYGDLEIHFDFMMSKGSNSGVKFHGVYEIQICDSFGNTKELTGNDCGGIYPRAVAKPKYTYLDKGIAPLKNACKAPGEWQALDAIFLAPRFDKDGKKVTNARLLKAVLNGEVIHDNIELKTPTGDNWDKKENATGPLMFQGDHGPVAFRNVRIRPYIAEAKK